ncbi:hypothetical protein ACIA8R_39350 [Nonomuraea sp. NPDC051191]|uniref:hypothetical protein n=1 Tax=Nonomuraea sp. NPDC051191 TaxID=3364372 RepID=UPI003794CE65
MFAKCSHWAEIRPLSGMICVGDAGAERVPDERAAGRRLRGQETDVVEPAHADARGGEDLRLVLGRRAKLLRRLVPLRLPVEVQLVAVGVAEGVLAR